MISCDTGPTFSWNPEIEETVSGDLTAWLKSAPFDGLWDPNDNDRGDVYITNAREVFPFIGELINEDNNLVLISEKNRPFYKEQLVVFKDPTWGESVVYGSLLYDSQELFMRKSYSKSANIITDGLANMNNRNYASLGATELIATTADHKTAAYWVQANNTTYLMGFYQKDQLAFQVAFPCPMTKKEKGLAQLKKVAATLQLDIPAWKNAAADDLARADRTDAFWQDPYIPLFYSRGLMPIINIKLKGTLFEKETFNRQSRSSNKASISHVAGDKTYTLTISKEDTELSALAFRESETSKPLPGAVDKDREYILETTESGAMTQIKATTYYKDHQVFVFTYTYPTAQTDQAAVLNTVLQTIKISRYTI
ncbi:hypothetical protein EAX61_05715 [Dokdonia sinensis]|uniref:Uncharacterized protein n=1 Tax=Dokdonia sinensis TaxID=2479847 RepID=A0A3M0G979_9FLAO|nr:hypothetical protein EAX61_05715 [Dokdonia sinensis]